jgi:2-amino-4-hydroxy-6-hydroxymethyldihydropteridine diphosphokinase
VPILARFNRQLITDEASETRLTLDDLEERMRGWLRSEYHAVLFHLDEVPVAYVLFRPSEDGIFIRQFFVIKPWRGHGIGRRALEMLSEKVWPQHANISVHCLAYNRLGLHFWRAVGFADYVMTLRKLAPARIESREVLIALGSNLGDSARVIRAAMDELDRFAAMPCRRSSLWKSSPVDCPPGSPPFVNAAIAFEPVADETPESLLARLQAMEKTAGRRKKKVLNEPRPLDLDLIAFGSATRSSRRLILPHPRAHLRRFVLAPLMEIAPDFILPGQTRTIRRLFSELKAEEVITRLR